MKTYSYILIGVYLLSTVLDIAFTSIVAITKPVFNEINPLFSVLGLGVWAIVTVNIIFSWLMIKGILRSKSKVILYVYVLVICFATLAHGFGAYTGYNNLQHQPDTADLTPEQHTRYVEVNQKQPEELQQYSGVLGWITYGYIISNIIIFVVWERVWAERNG